MTSQIGRICKKHIGSKIEFMGRDEVITGKVLKVQNGIATVEHNVQGKTYVAYIEAKGPHIVAIHEIVAYSLTLDEILKATA